MTFWVFKNKHSDVYFRLGHKPEELSCPLIFSTAVSLLSMIVVSVVNVVVVGAVDKS